MASLRKFLIDVFSFLSLSKVNKPLKGKTKAMASFKDFLKAPLSYFL